jgi:membrane protease YdiL (CAAX protease family)
MRHWAIALAITAGISVALALGFREDNAGKSAFWLTVVGVYGVVAILAVGWAVVTREWDWLLPRWGDITKGFFTAALCFAITFGMVKLLVAGTPREAWIERVYHQLGDPTKLKDAYGKVAALIVVASAAEEIVWRGFVTRQLEPVVGSRRAWILSALLYGGAHVPTVWVLGNPGLLLAAVGLGLALGALARMNDGRIAPGIVAHALFDITATMMFRLVGTSV